MVEELWKPVSGYEGLYEVSNHGRMRSLARNTTSGKILSPVFTWQGYARVHLWKNGKAKYHAVHRIVAEAFIPNPEGKPMVNHIDENKSNNHAGNLEWVTHIENCYHGTGIQRMSKALTNHPRKSKQVAMYTKDGEMICVFPSLREAERKTGILHRGISFCCQGKESMAGGYIWKYHKN